MSTLGGRLGHAARRRLPETAGASLRAIYGVATCAVDGIAVTTGCSEGAGTLQIEDRGRHLLLLRDVGGGLAVTAEIRPETLDMAAVYRRFDEALERERSSLGVAELAQRLQEKASILDALLPKLRTWPEDELLLVQTIEEIDAGMEGCR
jgi:formylmethanofuran dehydrogenase subunit E